MRTLQLTISPVVPPGEVHISTDWEIASDSEFINIVHVVNSTTDLTTYNAAAISTNIDVFARGRMVTDLGTMSHFSATAVDVVTTPLVNMPGGQYSATGTSIFTTSAYVSIDATNTHSSTDWVITNIEDNSIIWESLADTVNLTTITVPIGILEKRVSYRMNARHNGSVIASAHGTKSFMIVTIADDNIVVIDAPLLAVEGEPNNVVLSPGLTTSAFNVSIGTDTHISTDWVIEDNVGNVVWQSLADTVNKLNIPSPSITLVEGTPYVFRARHNGAVVSSGWTSETHTTITLSINAWTSTANYPIAMERHSQSTLLDGRVLVVGGWRSSARTDLAYIYNPVTDVWSNAANYPMAIWVHTQSTLLDGRVLVVGGWSNTGRTSHAYIYNPVTNEWTIAADYPMVLWEHSQSTLLDGRVLVVGGGDAARTNLANIYNPATNVWSSAANYPMAISSHTQSTLLDGRVLVVCGRDVTSRTNLANIYDPVTNLWTSVANYPRAINSHSQSTLPDGRVLVVGGNSSVGATNIASIYNPTTDVWSSVANYSTTILHHSQSTLIDGRVLVVCGVGPTGETNTTTIYTP